MVKVFISQDKGKEAKLRQRLEEIVEVANTWFIPLMQECGLQLTMDTLAGAMSGDSVQYFINKIIDQKVGSSFSPSEVYMAGKTSRRAFDRALFHVITSSAEYTKTVEDLSNMAGRKWNAVQAAKPDSYDPRIFAAQRERKEHLSEMAAKFDQEQQQLLSEKRDEIKSEFLGQERVFYHSGLSEKSRMGNGIADTDYHLKDYAPYLTLTDDMLSYDPEKVREACSVYTSDRQEIEFLKKLDALEKAIKETFGAGAKMSDLELFFGDRVENWEAHISRKDIRLDVLHAYANK